MTSILGIRQLIWVVCGGADGCGDTQPFNKIKLMVINGSVFRCLFIFWVVYGCRIFKLFRRGCSLRRSRRRGRRVVAAVVGREDAEQKFTAHAGVGRVGGRKFRVGGVWIIDRLNFHGTTICTVSLGAAWPASLAAMT